MISLVALSARLHCLLHRLRHAETGAVTAEFVVIFPALLMLLAFIAFVSLALAAQSEVQQVAFELARFGLALEGNNYSGDICTKLASDYLPRLIQNSVTLSSAKFQPLGACPSQPDANGVLTITVTYDLAGSAAAEFSNMLGVHLGRITRYASVIVK